MVTLSGAGQTNVALDPANVGVLSTMRALLNEWMIDTEDTNPVPLPVIVGKDKKPWFAVEPVTSRS